jgi:circadian clock protein KaiC
MFKPQHGHVLEGSRPILLVDDDEDLRDAVAALLHSKGHQVIQSANGQLALDALALNPGARLIILDLMMPVMDGLTFLAHKARSAHAGIPVVIFSSSLSLGLDSFADVVSVIHKLDGIDGLLAGIRLADVAELLPTPSAEVCLPEASPAPEQPDERPQQPARIQSSCAVTKMLTGIKGFDEITEGGLPRGRTSLVMGGPGSGKTVFALQSLVNAAQLMNEAGLFVAFEESTPQIVVNAGTFGWDLLQLAKKKLFFLDTHLSSEGVKAGEFDLVSILAFLRTKALEIDAKLIVFDGIDVLLGLLDDPVAERRDVYRIRDWLLQTGLTGIITQRVGALEADHRYGFLQFMVDCVVVLRHELVDGSAFRNLRVMKYRGSGFSGDEFPITLTREGLQLTHRGPTEFEYEVTDERISTGLPRLDHMLRGGYHRGSNVLISGAPGTAKSTLSGLFAIAACERGERTLYVSFDEGGAQIVRNLRSVGIHFEPHLTSGLLKMHSTRTRGPNIEDQFGELRAKVRAHKPRCLVIDPLSALASKIAHLASADAVQQFLDFLKGEGITVVNTSLVDGLSTDEATANGISTIADTWIHVSYVVQDGERNRALTIVKSRGTGHSNQVRELTLSNEGVTLADVFVAQGKVLMGVARWEWEQEEQAAKQRVQVATELKRLQLQVAQAEAVARLQVVQTEIEARTAEMAVLALATGSASELVATDQEVLRRMRHADDDGGVLKRGGALGIPALNGETTTH